MGVFEKRETSGLAFRTPLGLVQNTNQPTQGQLWGPPPSSVFCRVSQNSSTPKGKYNTNKQHGEMLRRPKHDPPIDVMPIFSPRCRLAMRLKSLGTGQMYLKQ